MESGGGGHPGSMRPEPWAVAVLALLGVVTSGCVRSPEGVSFVGGSDPTAAVDTGDPKGSSEDGGTEADEGGSSDDGSDGAPIPEDTSSGSEGAQGDTGGSSDGGGAETGNVAGGCNAGATTVLATEVNTLVLPGALRGPGLTNDAPHGSIHIASSGDLCELSITITPSDPDLVRATLRDPEGLAIAGAECTAMIAGGPCTVVLADGPGAPAVLRLELRDEGDGMLGGLGIAVSATTEGLAAPIDIEGAFRDLDQSDFVLFPVGPQTGPYSYVWSSPTDTHYNLGIVAPSGSMNPILDTASANTSGWPSSGAPQGWYLVSASTTAANGMGDAWTLTIEP